MIVSWEQLEGLRGQVAMVDGGFDPLHPGHVEYFAAAAELGAPLLCNVSSDRWVTGKHPVLLPQPDRARVIDALRAVSYVHAAQGTTLDVLGQLRPRIYVKGADWRNRLPAEELAVCEEFGIEIAYLDTVSDSSTRILRRYLEEAQKRNP